MAKIKTHFRPLKLIGITLLLLGIIGLLYFSSNTPVSGYPIPKANNVLYGIQLDWKNDSVQKYSSRLGNTPKLFGIYAPYPLDEGLKKLVDQNIESLTARKSTIMLTLEPRQGLGSINDTNLNDLKNTLQGWNDQGLPVLVRFAHEMNGSWYPWAQQPTEYIKYFRLVANTIHQTTLSSILWSPNEAGGYPYSGGQFEIKQTNPDYKLLDTNHDGHIDMYDDPYTPYYPGNKYVDWVGLSIYHYGVGWPWGKNTIPEDDKLIDKIRGNYKNAAVDETGLPDFYKLFAEDKNKPFAISETSALYINKPNNGDSNIDIKKSWIKQVYSDSLKSQCPNLKLITWFDYEKTERDTASYKVDWRVTSDPAILNILQSNMPDWVEFGRDNQPI